MGERAGWIDIDVYTSGEAGDGDEEELRISTRGLPKTARKLNAFEELQKNLRAANNVKIKEGKVRRRGPGGLLIAESVSVREVRLDTDEMPNTVHLGGISIQYYSRAESTAEPTVIGD
jgi:hypothetical protein